MQSNELRLVGVVLLGMAGGCGGKSEEFGSTESALRDDDRGSNKIKVLRPNDEVDGRSLKRWTLDYWQWFLSGADPARARRGDVYFPAIPAGEPQSEVDGCVHLAGSQEINVREGTTLYMPVAAWTFERYGDGSVDPPQPTSILDGASITIDGKPLKHLSSYLNQGNLRPELAYPAPTDYGSVGVVSVMAIGFLTEPLDPGVHELHVIDDFCPAVLFDNTFNLKVEKKRHGR